MTGVFFKNREAGCPVLMLQWFSLSNAIITLILFIKVLFLNCCFKIQTIQIATG